jgi:hypothetical protein
MQEGFHGYHHPMVTRADLDTLMADLDRQVPKLKATISEEMWLRAWTEHANRILSQAVEGDRPYVAECLAALALRHGLTIGTFGTS